MLYEGLSVSLKDSWAGHMDAVAGTWSWLSLLHLQHSLSLSLTQKRTIYKHFLNLRFFSAMPFGADTSIIFLYLGLFLRNLSWQLKSVIRPQYCFPWSIYFYIGCSCSNLARSESPKNETAKVSKLVKTTLAGLPDWKDTPLWHLKTFQLSQWTALLSNHVILSFPFIFAVSVYFMSTNEAGEV